MRCPSTCECIQPIRAQITNHVAFYSDINNKTPSTYLYFCTWQKKPVADINRFKVVFNVFQWLSGVGDEDIVESPAAVEAQRVGSPGLLPLQAGAPSLGVTWHAHQVGLRGFSNAATVAEEMEMQHETLNKNQHRDPGIKLIQYVDIP